MNAPGPAARIRRAASADAPQLAALRYEFRAGLASSAGEPRDEFLRRCERWMTDRLASAGSWQCWVAEAAGEIVGTLWLCLIEKIPNPVQEPETHGYVTNFYVRPARRGGGLGTALLEQAIAECRRRGVDAVILWPTPESRPLYQRHGFAVHDDLLERREP